MRRPRRLPLLAALPLLLASFAGSPVAMAQGECPLLSVDEVNATLGITDAALNQGSAQFCTFSGAVFVSVGIQFGQSFEQVKSTYPGGEDLTVAGSPAYLAADGSNLSVDLGDRTASVFVYGGETPASRETMIALAELFIPRLPAGPDPADTARLEALMPAAIDGSPLVLQTIPGDLLMGFMDQSAAPVIALNEALAAQGRTAADILMLGGETESSDDDYSAVAVLIKGADAAPLLEPLLRAFSASLGEATFTPQQIGSRTVTKVEGGEDQETLYVISSGDILFAVAAPEAELEAIFSVVP